MIEDADHKNTVADGGEGLEDEVETDQLHIPPNVEDVKQMHGTSIMIS
jgi:hypothetical protein